MYRPGAFCSKCQLALSYSFVYIYFRSNSISNNNNHNNNWKTENPHSPAWVGHIVEFIDIKLINIINYWENGQFRLLRAIFFQSFYFDEREKGDIPNRKLSINGSLAENSHRRWMSLIFFACGSINLRDCKSTHSIPRIFHWNYTVLYAWFMFRVVVSHYGQIGAHTHITLSLTHSFSVWLVYGMPSFI